MSGLEILGGVAAVLSLIKATRTITESAKCIHQNIHQAPTELEELISRLKLVQAWLEQIAEYESNPKTRLPQVLRSSLQLTLASVGAKVTEIRTRYAKYNQKGKFKRRVKLAFLDTALLKEHANRLHAAETTLSNHLQFLCLQKLEEIYSKTSAHVNHTTVYTNSPSLERVKARSGFSISSTRSWGWRTRCGMFSATRISSAKIQTPNMKYTEFACQLHSELPFTGYALQLECRFRTSFPLCRSMSFMHGGAVFSRVIPDDSEYLKACRDGNVSIVRELFRKGVARPEDISKSNMTPLLYAAQSGKPEVVQFLLDNGAAVNWVAGKRQTSPLQWAIQHNHHDVARTLIENSADLDHISTFGWSPLFYCWPRMSITGTQQTEMLKLLVNYTVLDFEQVDIMDWTAIQRAAALGTFEDIETLVKFGASPLDCKPPLQWSAIHYAVAAGNWDTFKALSPFYGDIIKDILDERGWYLLHIAASNGHEGLIRYLLENGLNPSLRTQISSLEMPESLFDRRCTAEDVAEGYGYETYKAYLTVVQDLGIDADWDEYWDAEE